MLRLFPFLLFGFAALTAAESPTVSPDILRARQELERVREQVAAGLLPAARIVEAQQAIDDAGDEDILVHTLYGHIQVEDLSEGQATEMVSAAERRAARVQQKVEHGKTLIAAGIGEPYLFADLESELARRQKVVMEAQARAALLMEMVSMAQAEAAEPELARGGLHSAEEHVEGDHLLEPKDVKAITLAFEKEFHEPLPVSARGDTAVHRAMGFDHTGRIDVALTPDSSQGVWLRKYLASNSIPYYAFRTAIPGKATAAHIHIGPGSTRIHAD